MPKITATEENRLSTELMKLSGASSTSRPDSALIAERAVFLHDVFNLVALAAVNSLNFWFLLYGNGFSAFWSVTMAYFIIDFAWILLQPRCVKSPSVLLTHHVVAAAYMFLPFFYPFTAPKMSYVMTVEDTAQVVPVHARPSRVNTQVNTWLLIARRVMPSALIEALFYTTWFIIRVVFFPYLVWDVTVEYRRVAAEGGTWAHPIAIAPVIQVALCLLNAQWTVELLRKLFRSRGKKASKPHHL